MNQLKIKKQITNQNELSVALYFREVNRYPMVSLEEEVKLALKIKEGDERAKRKLVEANLRFVISVAKQFQNQGLSFADLINEGNVGLILAADRFDETRGFKFISYAVWWIRQRIIQAISEQARMVRLPLNRLTSLNKIAKAIPYLEQQYEREPTDNELAEYLEVKEEKIAFDSSIRNQQVSFDKPIFEDSGTYLTLYDFIQGESELSPDNEMIIESTKIDILRAIGKLKQRESEILILSFGLNNLKPYNLNQIANMLSMTSERVRQIRHSALINMKRLLLGKKNIYNKY